MSIKWPVDAPQYGIQRCKKCGLWQIVRLYCKVRKCPNCGHQWLLHPRRRHTYDLCYGVAYSLEEAQRLLKFFKESRS